MERIDPKHEIIPQVTDERFRKFQERIKKMRKREWEFAQTRSSFQIEKFIACDEYSDVTKYRHLSHNSYVVMQGLLDAVLSREGTVRKINRLKKLYNSILLKKENRELTAEEEEKYENLDIMIYQLEESLFDVEMMIKGSMEELEVFERLCDELEKKNGHPFTKEEFEADQPQYWKLRLSSQMHNAQVGAKYGIGEGNYSSYLKALEQPILPDSKNVLDAPISFDINRLAVTALSNRKNVGEKLLVSGPPTDEMQ